ncbi:stalk domain-containing protein [Anaerobacillus alkaliphilus]|nr:stalk domain-containing protein [Anaerobacillus alkaliphilus]
MKQLLKINKLIPIIIVGLFLLPTTGFAKSTVEERCGYKQQPGVNPSYQMVNCLLTETALDFNVPPEVVKGIAEVESSDWRHFNTDGSPIITADGGIGIMQITLYQIYDQERLKNDIVYNIETGVRMLDAMFKRNDLPKVNAHEREFIEHWYFAVMAYNGTKPINSPIVQATGERNRDAYQEKVFKVINTKNFLTLRDLPFDSSYFIYDSTSSDNIKFAKRSLTTNSQLTRSKHLLKKGDYATVTSKVRLRQGPTTTSNEIDNLQKNQKVKILNGFTYESNVFSKNHFGWYSVQLTDGRTGFVASSYLELSTTPTIILQLNNPTAQVNGSPVNLAAAPYTTNGRTLVPLRFISESLGANVHWNSSTRVITIKMDGKVLTLRDGSPAISVTYNGLQAHHTIDVAPIIRNGVTFVPIRFISEQIGARVDWNGQTRTVTIYK